MVLAKRPVLGRPTLLMIVGQGPTALIVVLFRLSLNIEN